MLIKKIQDVPAEKVQMKGARDVKVRVLFGPRDGAPTFAMRIFELDRQGHTPLHDHPFEYKHLTYDNAGHQIRKFYLPMAGSTAVAGGRLVLGGTIEGNTNALRDSWPKVLEFLGSRFMQR